MGAIIGCVLLVCAIPFIINAHRQIVEDGPAGWWVLFAIHVGAVLWLEWDHLGALYAIFIGGPLLIMHWNGFNKYWERKLDEEERYERRRRRQY